MKLESSGLYWFEKYLNIRF